MARKIDIYIPCSQGPHTDQSSTCPALQSIADTCGQSGAPACECLVGQSIHCHTYICTQAFVHIRTYTATHTPISTCIHIGIRIHICTNRHTNTSAHATPNVHAHKHTHTHTHIHMHTDEIHTRMHIACACSKQSGAPQKPRELPHTCHFPDAPSL